VTYRLIDTDPDPETVASVTYVMFTPTGEVVALGEARPVLPTCRVAAGESYLLDTSLHGLLAVAAFHIQRVHPFAVDNDHMYAWVEGDPYDGWRPHADVRHLIAPAEQLVERLRMQGEREAARIVEDATSSYCGQDAASYYADNVRLLEPAYLRGTSPQAGSGFGGDAAAWRERRGMIAEVIDRDGTFLDVGCANGLLMESVQVWAAERGHVVEPYGVDLAPGLVALALRRLPLWADRIEVGNAIDYLPADGRRFTFVHTLLECVPAHARAAMLEHARRSLVEPHGRLIVSHYGHGVSADDLTALGYRPTGEQRRPGASTAWIDQDQER